MTTNEILERLEWVRELLQRRKVTSRRLNRLIYDLKEGGESEEVELYVESGGTRCPSCASTEIEGQEITVDNGVATQGMFCNVCDATWTDVYRLVRFTGLEK